MKIGVSGASGHLGRATVAELVQRPAGHGGSGDPAHARDHYCAGPGGRFGDYNRPESLVEASAGLDRLLIIPGPGTRKARGAERRCNRRGGEGGRLLLMHGVPAWQRWCVVSASVFRW